MNMLMLIGGILLLLAVIIAGLTLTLQNKIREGRVYPHLNNTESITGIFVMLTAVLVPLGCFGLGLLITGILESLAATAGG